MQRRKFLQFAGMSAALGQVALVGCNGADESKPTQTAAVTSKTWEWKMVTTWPKNFPGLGTGAEFLAKLDQ